MQINGHCDPIFENVRETFETNFTERGDLGASFCLIQDGEVRVDIWGGHLDEARTELWHEDSIVNVWSTTKTMTALSALLLADRGELDLDAPVVRYWPEFGASGKETIPVSNLMAHTAGLSGLDEPTVPEDLYDWGKITTLLAAQAPWWEPGTASGYHAITQGYLVGEVVRRISGVSLGTFFRTEIAEPLGVDFHIGLGPQHDARVAPVVPPPGPAPSAQVGADTIAGRTFANPFAPAEYSRTVEWRRAEIPAAGGTGNARSVARAQSLLACGGDVFGKRLMSEAGCRRALEEQINGTDLVLGVPLRHGLGYGLGNETMPLPSPNVCFWGGWGGSTIMVDLDNRIALSYVMNRMEAGVMGDPRGAALTLASYAALRGRG
ncbi:MAG: serine hydrolase domain-containing protein [Acidobacteriota bacterium]|nr:serine hydrolase domain-containing protein [Acidobacteriota bacterium]